MPAPTVSSVSPSVSSILGGVVATITGANFTGTTGITVQGIAATSVAVVSDTTLTCVLPAAAVGVASVLVTNGSGTNGANSFLVLIPATPTDTYIYLLGGRGDGFVPLWTGSVSEETQVEHSEPYRNVVIGSSTPVVVGSIVEAAPGFLNIPNLDAAGAPTSFTQVLDDNLKEASGTPTPPRQFERNETWLVFTSSNGLSYRFRKPIVIGLGSSPR